MINKIKNQYTKGESIMNQSILIRQNENYTTMQEMSEQLLAEIYFRELELLREDYERSQERRE